MHKLLMLLISVMLMSGCATKAIYEINLDPCLIFDPIHPSTGDTEGTKLQVETYMDSYTGLCNEIRD